jgi:hypothetical protein
MPLKVEEAKAEVGLPARLQSVDRAPVAMWPSRPAWTGSMVAV